MKACADRHAFRFSVLQEMEMGLVQWLRWDPLIRMIRNVLGFATNYQATQNALRVNTGMSDVVRDEVNALCRVAMDAARAEYSAHLAETARRLVEETSANLWRRMSSSWRVALSFTLR